MWIILIIFLIIFSIIGSYKIKFSNYKLNEIFHSFKGEKTSLFMSLGTKVGVGSIIGTASSIMIGGFSSVFWMIIFSLCTSSLIYLEAYFGKKYREKDNDEYVSGPYYIFKNGLNNKILSIISLILLVIIYSFLFQMIQSNTIANIFMINYGINKNMICVIFIVLASITVILNIKDIIHLMNRIVPIMCLLFVILSIVGIVLNIEELLINIKSIDIFNSRSFLTGMVIGVKRSIFMNETLIGTTSLTSGIDNNNNCNSAKIQVLGSYFISFVITVLLTLLLIIYNPIEVIDYNTLVSSTYLYTTGKYGLFILTIIILLFGVTTLLSGYYIGKTSITKIANNKLLTIIFEILFIGFVIIGIFIENNFIWKYLDILMFFMILINSYSIIKLLGSVEIDR